MPRNYILMNFCFALVCQFSKNLSDEQMFLLEEIFVENPRIHIEWIENGVKIFNLDLQNRENIGFGDYISEGKALKNFLLQENFVTEENYKNCFKMEKIQENTSQKNISDLDSLIAKVDKNDPKLLEVLNKIEKLKK